MTSTENDWLVWSLHLGVWWHDDKAQRSTDLHSAGRYTAEQAAEIATGRDWPSDHIAPPEVAVQIPDSVNIGEPGAWSAISELVWVEVERRKAARAADRSDSVPTGSHEAA